MLFSHGGFYTLLWRECLRFLNLASQTLLPSVITTVLYILVFGFFLGPRVMPIQGFTYIQYIFPGLLLMGAVMSAFQNSCTSLFIARQEKFIEDLLVAPISYVEMVVAFVLSATLRGFLVALLCVLVCLPIAKVPFVHPVLFVAAVFITSMVFGSAGVVAGLWARRWDHIAVIQNYLIMPLVFLGGVFYSTSTLPENLRWVLHVNPLFYMVNGLRFSFLGVADISFARSMLVTLAFAVFFTGLSVLLFKRGYNLRS